MLKFNIEEIKLRSMEIKNQFLKQKKQFQIYLKKQKKAQKLMKIKLKTVKAYYL